MVFESGSGLDPEISVRGALLQVDRIASARHFSNLQKQSLIDLVNKEVIHPDLGFLGEERVNVLLLNLDLDKLK
jgi:K+-transporting ATPase ATPase C chain